MLEVFTADRVFTGFDWLQDHAVITREGRIEDVLPIVSLPENTIINSHCNFIVPAFIDIQIYGASGKLFAVFPDADTLRLMYDYSLAGGANHFIPTVATNSTEVFKKCINAIREYWAAGGRGVPGLHIEGPWISSLKQGAHVEKFIHAPSTQEVQELIEYGEGVIKIITLAPEICSKEIITFIRSKDIIVSAGHSNATFIEATESFNNGIFAVTHLFNAMSSLNHREPGIPGAVIQHPLVMASIIADGYHVDFEIINIVKKLLGQRLFLITDAVTETSEGLYHHQIDEDRYICNGTLSGSSLTMIRAVINCFKKAGINEEEALRMGSLYPAKVLGLDHRLGLIKKGYDAELTFLDKEWKVIREGI